MRQTIDRSDGDLARAVSARMSGECEAAESELYRRFAPRVRLYGLRHLRDEQSAMDLVQTVMMLTIEKLRRGEVRDPDQIASFVLGTSRSMAIAGRRKDVRHELLRDKFLIAPMAHASPDVPLVFDLDRLEQCMGQLADRERSVVYLTFYADSPAAGVAAEVGISEGNVRVIRHRALAKLRGCVMALRQAS